MARAGFIKTKFSERAEPYMFSRSSPVRFRVRTFSVFYFLRGFLALLPPLSIQVEHHDYHKLFMRSIHLVGVDCYQLMELDMLVPFSPA